MNSESSAAGGDDNRLRFLFPDSQASGETALPSPCLPTEATA
ncbi:hypothetical protein [Brasilonema sennae]|nr:hypothetical protein [Brasilonema sennae]